MKNIFETIVGTFVVIFALVFLFFAYHKSGKHTQSSGYELYATFDHIDGLKMGSDVRIAGVKVGEVVSETLDKQNYNALVGIYLDKGIQLPIDSSASIISDGLLGDKYLSLSPGADNTMLQPGNTITYTQSSVNLETLIGKMIFQGNDNKSKPGTSDHNSNIPQ